MSVPQWQNLPVPESGGRGWAGFSADPRDPQYQHLRASDADRSNAATMLGNAYAEGRLDNDEYNQRLDQVMSSKSLGELVPVLVDVTPVPVTKAAAQQPGQRRGQGFIGPFPGWWLGLALMFNAIWLMTSLGSGRLLYYWPMWPMLGTAIPMIMAMMAGGGRVNRHDAKALPPPPEPPERDLR